MFDLVLLALTEIRNALYLLSILQFLGTTMFSRVTIASGLVSFFVHVFILLIKMPI